MIINHNSEYDNGVHTFKIGENHLADMISDEIVSMMNGLVFNATDIEEEEPTVTAEELADLPDSVDWRDKV